MKTKKLSIFAQKLSLGYNIGYNIEHLFSYKQTKLYLLQFFTTSPVGPCYPQSMSCNFSIKERIKSYLS